MSTDFNFPDLPKGMTVGSFVLEKRLSSEGRMSQLFNARAITNGGRRVALKIARTDDAVFTSLIREEVQLLANIRHPGIVHIYPIDLGGRTTTYIGRATSLQRYFGGTPPYYYTMEMLTGGSLEDNKRNNTLKRMPLDWKIELIYQIAVTLLYLHSLNIAHLDLKPDNIVLRRKPDPRERPEPVIVDFGTASRADRGVQVRAGSPAYLSPERVTENRRQKALYRTTKTSHVDWRPSDVWALGMITYEVLTGEYPYRFRNLDDLFDKILHQPVDVRRLQEPLQTLLVGRMPPSARGSAPHSEYTNGMLSPVRENRADISEVIRLLDTTAFLPPRIEVKD